MQENLEEARGMHVVKTLNVLGKRHLRSLVVFSITLGIGLWAATTNWGMRGVHSLLSDRSVSVAGKKVKLQSPFFIVLGTARPEYVYVGGFYTDNQTFPHESMLSVVGYSNMRGEPLAILQAVCSQRKCDSFQVHLVKETLCASFWDSQGFGPPAFKFNLMCPFPKHKTMISYHGSEERLPFFQSQFDALLDAAK